MREQETRDLEEGERTALLAAFEAHLPTSIESEAAWVAARSQLGFALSGRADGSNSASAGRARRRTLRSLRAAAVLVAATCALGLVLAGAGYIKEHTMALDPGMQRIADERLYQVIDQTRQADGVTVTVTAAYLDRGRTVIYYTLSLAPALRARYERAFLGSWSVTDQAGAEPAGTGGVGTCEPWPADGSPIHCYTLEGPIPQAAGTRTVALHFDVMRVYLLTKTRGNDAAPGPWNFTFTVPYHQTDIGSVSQFFPHLMHLVPGQQP